MLIKVVSRSTVLATIIALSLASISATSVFAAGQAHRESAIRSSDLGLASQWKTEVAAFKAAELTDKSIGKWATEWKEIKRSPDDLRKEGRYAALAAADLRQAELLVAKHAGFNAEGKVTNKVQANQAIQDLALALHRFHMDVADKLRTLFA